MYNKGERKEKIFASKAVKAEEKRERKRKKEKERNAHLPDFFKVGAYVAHRRCRHSCVTFAKGLCEQQTCDVLREKEEQKERNLSKNEKGTYSYDAIIGY